MQKSSTYRSSMRRTGEGGVIAAAPVTSSRNLVVNTPTDTIEFLEAFPFTFVGIDTSTLEIGITEVSIALHNGYMLGQQVYFRVELTSGTPVPVTIHPGSSPPISLLNYGDEILLEWIGTTTTDEGGSIGAVWAIISKRPLADSGLSEADTITLINSSIVAARPSVYFTDTGYYDTKDYNLNSDITIIQFSGWASGLNTPELREISLPNGTYDGQKKLIIVTTGTTYDQRLPITVTNSINFGSFNLWREKAILSIVWVELISSWAIENVLNIDEILTPTTIIGWDKVEAGELIALAGINPSKASIYYNPFVNMAGLAQDGSGWLIPDDSPIGGGLEANGSTNLGIGTTTSGPNNPSFTKLGGLGNSWALSAIVRVRGLPLLNNDYFFVMLGLISGAGLNVGIYYNLDHTHFIAGNILGTSVPATYVSTVVLTENFHRLRMYYNAVQDKYWFYADNEPPIQIVNIAPLTATTRCPIVFMANGARKFCINKFIFVSGCEI